jgi:hypothetical protein
MNAIRPAPKASNVIAQTKRGTSAGLIPQPHKNRERGRGGVLRAYRRFLRAFAVIVLAIFTSQSAVAEIGYDSLPAEIKQKLETVIPVVRWRYATPQQALTDIIEKVNAVSPSSKPLKVSPPNLQPTLGWETFTPPPIRPGGTLADSAVKPDTTINASVCQLTARELIEYVCERCGLEIADFGEGVLNLVPATRQNSLVSAKVEVPNSVRRECEELASVSWLTGIGWKRALLLKCDVSPNLQVKWMDNDTRLHVDGFPEDVWKVRRVVREIAYREQTKQRSMTDSERRFWHLYKDLHTVRINVPEGDLPLDALIQLFRDEAGKKNIALNVHIPPGFEKLLPAKTVFSSKYNPTGAIPGLDPDPAFYPTAKLAEGFLHTLLNYGLDLAYRNESEFTLVRRNLHRVPDFSDDRMFTWEWKVSPAQMAVLVKNNEEGRAASINISGPPGSIAIHSKTTNMLTVKNYWWNLMLIDQSIDSAKKEIDTTKTKAKSPTSKPRR